MIAYDCDLAPICTGPAPFDANETPCCDEHEEEWTRDALWERGYRGGVSLRRLACTVGVAHDDMIAFVKGTASLTYPARVRVREVIGG